jgi:hypothetical protein
MIVLVRYRIIAEIYLFIYFIYYSAEATQLRRINKELEDNFLRAEQRFNQLQKTLMSFEEGIVSKFNV